MVDGKTDKTEDERFRLMMNIRRGNVNFRALGS